MKIAVTYDNGKLFRHFGHCENFKFYTVDNGQIVNTELINIEPKGQKHVAEFLGSQEITHLICGGLGGEARETLDNLGIEYFPKVNLTPDEAVDAYLAGNLEYTLERGCCGSKNGENHQHNHSCGCGCGKKK